jgi:hypothetical protein
VEALGSFLQFFGTALIVFGFFWSKKRSIMLKFIFIGALAIAAGFYLR